jgi:DNA-binding NtrC family response regulator
VERPLQTVGVMAAELLHEGGRNLGDGLSELRFEDLERWARGPEGLPLREWIALAEAWRIAQALREHRGNRSATARALGIGRRTLYTKMEKLGLEPSWSVARRTHGSGAEG